MNEFNSNWELVDAEITNLHEEMLQVKKRYEQVGVVLVIICILQLINLVLGFL